MARTTRNDAIRRLVWIALISSGCTVDDCCCNGGTEGCCPGHSATGCGAPVEDDAPTPGVLGSDCAAVLSSVPAADATDHWIGDDIEVEFESTPIGLQTELFDDQGDLVPTDSAQVQLGNLLRVDPDEDLIPDRDYELRLSWYDSEAASCEPYVLPFRTAGCGLPLDDEQALLSAVFEFDLNAAERWEPEEMGPILVSQLGLDHLLLASHQVASHLDEGVLHGFLVAGEVGDDGLQQIPCEVSLIDTLGADGVEGGGDDLDAQWDNPRGTLVAHNLTLDQQGMPLVLDELRLWTVAAADLQELCRVDLDLMVDIRAMGQEPDESCAMIEELTGAECEPCSDGYSGCFQVRAEAARAERVEVDVEPLSCVELIERSLAGEACPDAHLDFSPDGDGGYLGCPEYNP